MPCFLSYKMWIIIEPTSQSCCERFWATTRWIGGLLWWMFHDVNTRTVAFCPQTCLSSLLLPGTKESHFLFCFHESCLACHLSRPKYWEETDWKVSDSSLSPWVIPPLPENFTSVHCYLPNYQVHWFAMPCPRFPIALDLFFKVFLLLTSLMLEFGSCLF